MKRFYYLINILVHPINLFFKIIFQKKYQKPIIMVIGNHASGGTLIYQILSSCYKLNYINNISGKFYKNFFIIQIINILTDTLFKNYISNLKSINGITKGVVEPNEFGWFWKNIFKKNRETNVKYFKDYIANLNSIRDLPFLFKYSVFSKISRLSKNLKLFNKLKNKLIIIRIKRKKKKIINSIINRRKTLYKNINYQYGYFPKKIVNTNPFDQINKQVQLIEEELDSGLVNINKKNIFNIKLDSVIKDPSKELKKLDIFLKKHEIQSKNKLRYIIPKINKR